MTWIWSAWSARCALAGTLAVVVLSRGKVTPVANPRDSQGNPLVPKEQP